MRNWLRKQWVVILIVVAVVGWHILFVRIALSAWREEKEHSEFLYDCCHFDEPNVCENKWLALQGVRPDE